MIKLITGVPGSGKSYYEVKFIYDQLHLENPKYKYIYTNINMNFEECNKIKEDFVKPLILEDLLDRIQKDYELSELFKHNQLIDEETGEVVTDYDSYVRGKLKLFDEYEHSLIIIDECHLYFTENADKKLIRFLSYHRHFDLDIHLVTQNKSLINRKYLAFVENLIVGVNPGKRLISKVFVYKIYASYKETKNNFVGTEKLKFDPKVARLYNSGSTKIHESFAKRVILPAVIGIIAMFFVFMAFKNYMRCHSLICPSNTPKSATQVNPTQKEKPSPKKEPTRHRKDIVTDVGRYQYLYKITCFKEKCIYQDITIHKSVISNLEKISDSVLIYINTGSFFSTYYIASNLDLSKFKQIFGGLEDEKDNRNLFNFNKH